VGRRGGKQLRGSRQCVSERCVAPQDKWTPLHKAARAGHAAVVEKLLAAKADTEAQDRVRGEGGLEIRIGGALGQNAAFGCDPVFSLHFVVFQS